MREDASSDDLRTIDIKNRNYRREGSRICATHDICDANMVMDSAMRDVLGHSYIDYDEPTPERDHLMRIWNDAWTLASQVGFKNEWPWPQDLDP